MFQSPSLSTIKKVRAVAKLVHQGLSAEAPGHAEEVGHLSRVVRRRALFVGVGRRRATTQDG
jgi:hypothetical protein